MSQVIWHIVILIDEIIPHNKNIVVHMPCLLTHMQDKNCSEKRSWRGVLVAIVCLQVYIRDLSCTLGVPDV